MAQGILYVLNYILSEQIWLQSGNTFSKGDATTGSHTDGIPKGIYEVRLSMTGFYLEKIADSFVFNYKLYGLNQDFINYVLKTYNWNSWSFTHR